MIEKDQQEDGEPDLGRTCTLIIQLILLQLFTYIIF